MAIRKFDNHLNGTEQGFKSNFGVTFYCTLMNLLVEGAIC